MIIINQDKTEIINFDNTLNICLYPKYDDLDNEIGYEVYAGMKAPDDNYRTLGYYKTKERAKEVLREIAKRYLEYYQINGGDSILTNGVYIPSNMFDFPKVYEMPKD